MAVGLKAEVVVAVSVLTCEKERGHDESCPYRGQGRGDALPSKLRQRKRAPTWGPYMGDDVIVGMGVELAEARCRHF